MSKLCVDFLICRHRLVGDVVLMKPRGSLHHVEEEPTQELKQAKNQHCSNGEVDRTTKKEVADRSLTRTLDSPIDDEPPHTKNEVENNRTQDQESGSEKGIERGMSVVVCHTGKNTGKGRGQTTATL